MNRPSLHAVGLAAVLASLLPVRHAAAAASDIAPPPAPEVRYKPGAGFTLANTDDFTLSIGGRVQARYTNTSFDDMRNKAPLGSFTAERVRVSLKGTLFHDWKFGFENDFGKGASALKQAWISWAKYDQFQIEAGQFNAKFDRSQYTSSAKQMFVDRSLAAGAYGWEYDVGMDFAGALKSRKFMYNVGVFEGEKIGTSNANNGQAYIARLSFNPNGDFGMSESDYNKTDYNLWTIDLAGMWNLNQWKDGNSDGKAQPGEVTDTDTYAFGFGYKHKGVYLSAEDYQRHAAKDDGTGKVNSRGFYAQFGYTIVRNEWEVALRYSESDPDTHVDHNSLRETTLGLNRYFKNAGHALKLQGDVSWLDEQKTTDTLHDLRFRLQLQILF